MANKSGYVSFYSGDSDLTGCYNNGSGNFEVAKGSAFSAKTTNAYLFLKPTSIGIPVGSVITGVSIYFDYRQLTNMNAGGVGYNTTFKWRPARATSSASSGSASGVTDMGSEAEIKSKLGCSTTWTNDVSYSQPISSVTVANDTLIGAKFIADSYNVAKTYLHIKELTITVTYTEPHTHSYTTETERTASTCYTKGSVTKQCSCGETQTTELALDPNNHAGGTEIRNAVSATCTATGYTGDTYCKGCGAKLSSGSTIAKKSHTEVTIPAVAPTCTATGLTAGKKCSVCNTIITAQQTVAALGHSYEGVVTTAPTCTGKGVKTFTCKNDASHKYTEEIEALGHSYTSTVTSPTETSSGYTTHTCTRCGHSYVDSYIHRVTVKSSNSNYGTVAGSGDYEDGKTVTITATPKDGCKFVRWLDGDTSASRTITVTSTATYTAIFALDIINNIYVNTVKPKAIYYDAENIVFVVDGIIPTPSASQFDTVDGYHIKVQNTIPSGMTKCKTVYRDLVKVYG